MIDREINKYSVRNLTITRESYKHNIIQNPNEEQLNNLRALSDYILKPLSKKFGKDFDIISGFRTEELNNIVYGKQFSDHLYGCAVDIYSKDNNDELISLIKSMIDNDELHCREVRVYKNKVIHLSINNNYNITKHNQYIIEL